MVKVSTLMLCGVAAISLVGCSTPADKPNMTLTPPSNPAAIAILNKLKAMPTAVARRQYMDSHQADTQTLRGDAGSWVEASKLAWSDVPATPVTMNSGPAKTGN